MMYIEDCCEILDSMRVPITASDREEGDYPYYGANGIQDHVADYIFDDELVLLAEDGGNFGSKEKPIAYRVSGKCWINNHAHVLKPKIGLDVDYLCYSLMFYNVDGMVNGATRQKLTQAAMRKMQIPSRSIEDQKHIVDELNRIVKIKEQRFLELQLLDKLIKARFVEMFENEIEYNKVKLEEIADIVSGITKGRKTKCGELREVPYMAVSNVKDGYIDWTTVKTILATEDEIIQYKLLPDDVLMTEGGDPDKLGRGAIISLPPKDCIHQNHIFRVRLDETQILPRYFAAYLQSSQAKTYFLRAAKQTTGIASINMSQLRGLPTIVPPIELQLKYSLFSEQVDKSKVVVQKALDEAQILFDSLMQKYFG
ncbi:Type I restriction enzyme EcoKI specificity protein [Coprococcus eutactus]|nr:Type I restriction enzyme EcoKI specificity protein [Coprococcus eutactus]